MPGLLDALDGDPQVDARLDDVALVRALLDVEAALARAGARAGVLPGTAAAAITAACGALAPDPADLGRRSLAAGNPVVPLVRELTGAVPEAARPWVHRGATSQDVLDTALVLLLARAGTPLLAHADAAADAAAVLARTHARTLAVARTLGQQALATTFGLRAANWSAGLRTAAGRLRRTHRAALAVQLGGAVGTLSALGDAGPAVAAHLADELGLVPAPAPWHTERSRLHAVAGALTGVVVAAGKVGTDVVLLSAGEVGEVSEGGGADHGGSSAMPHKRNPVTSVLLVAAARRAPAQLAAVVGAGVHEQERATGSWHAEWQPLRDLAHLAGGSAARATDVLGGLQVHPERMLANLLSAGPGLAAEPVATALAPALGRGGAQDAVRAALATVTATGRDLADVLGDDPAVAAVLDAPARARLADPASSLGPVDSLVEALLSVGTEVAW